MAHKLTIRRVGGCLPALSLVVVLLLSIAIGWLSLAGLPPEALRYIEQELAAQGVHLKLNALKLEPSRGLAFRAEGLRYYPAANATSPLITADSFSIGINASRLLTGVLSADTLHLRNAAIELPTQQAGEKKLHLDKIDISARLTRRQIARLTSASLQLEGIPIRLRGAYDLAPFLAQNNIEEQKETSSAAVYIQRFIQEHTPVFDQIYRYITAQQWSAEEKPSIELQLQAAGKKTLYAFKITIPRYDWQQFHFRQATADILYQDNTITIHSLRFNTVSPHSTASLQAGFSIPDKNLSFTLESNADLLSMVQPFLDKKHKQILQKLSHPAEKAPSIKLSGDLVFASNWLPDQAHIRGGLGVEELSVGEGRIDKLELSFIYHNGDFNIDKLAVLLPTGSANMTAKAQKGKGEAEVQADLNVVELINLINQFTEKPITMPADMQLHGNLKITAQAKLTTLPLNATQEEWENFIPSCNNLNLQLSTDKMTYRGHSITRPCLELHIEDIVQGNNKIPENFSNAMLHCTAEEVHIVEEENTRAQFRQLDLLVKCKDFSLGEDKPQIGELQLQTTLQHLESGAWVLDDISIPQLRFSHITPQDDILNLFKTAQWQAHIGSIAHDGYQLGKAELDCTLPEPGKGSLKTVLENEEGNKIRLTTTADWSTPGQLILGDIKLNAPVARFASLMEHFGIISADFELPNIVDATGACTWNLSANTLEKAQVELNIPELVRTPYKLIPFRGMRIPIGLQASIHLHPAEDGGIVYDADLDISHQTGDFQGKAKGNTASYVHITGHNTIRADIIDRLIDNEDAHGIIRDFRFSPRSRNIISNIDTLVRYDNGTIVTSHCDAQLIHTEYLMCAIEERPDKTEYLRTDLGSNPYSYAKLATCGVDVDVRLDSVDAQGKKLKDKICITLTHPQITYDNGPWLRRQKFATGTAETHLGGDAVIIDVENSFVELVNVSGTVYPAYSIGMFYADIQHFMADIVLPRPARVETASCVFPIYSDCKRPMSGTIRTIAAKDAAFNFLGTSIPLNDFSGFIYLTDDYVQLDKMNAKSWGGVLDAVVRIGFRGEHTSFDGYVKAANMDLHHIAAAYGSVQAYALCNGFIRFRTPSPNINDLQAYGEVEITDGDLLTLSLFRPVNSYISELPSNLMKLESLATKTGVSEEPSFFTRSLTRIFSAFQKAVNRMGDSVDKVVYYVPGANHLLSYDLQEAYARFNIANGRITTNSMRAIGHNLNVQMEMGLDLNTLVLHGNIWPKVSSLPTLILSPLTFLSDFMVDIVIHGSIDDLDWHFALDRRLHDQEPSATNTTPGNNPPPIKQP